MSTPTPHDFSGSLEFARRYYKTIGRIARQHGECADDLVQDLHIHFPTWMSTHNPARGMVSTHIFNKLAWYLRSRKRLEFRHVTCELNDEFDYQADDEAPAGLDLRDAPLPQGLPDVVRTTLQAARGCQTRGEVAEKLGITLRGLDKRMRRAEALASVREPVQTDLFGFALEGV